VGPVIAVTATIATAAITCAAYAALRAGHAIGDYPLQRDADAIGKAYPADELLAAGMPWYHGWTAIQRHVLTYLSCQAVALVLLIALVAPIPVPGAWAALIISGSTHAVIDRRPLVTAIVRAKGAGHSPSLVAHVDQALHHGVLLLAAVAAACITSWFGVLVVDAAAIALIAAALVWEYRHARALQPAAAAARPGW
jgi:hypothetical protein